MIGVKKNIHQYTNPHTEKTIPRHKFSLEVQVYWCLKLFLKFTLNTHCALVVALSEKIKYHSVWL